MAGGAADGATKEAGNDRADQGRKRNKEVSGFHWRVVCGEMPINP